LTINNPKPRIIEGRIFTDERGEIKFVNDFAFEDIKRFYIIKNKDISIIRAWQAHKLESKYFYTLNGSFQIAWVKIDNWANPSMELKSENVILSGGKSQILFIPGGYANGFRALQPDSALLVFSNMNLDESKKDDYRFNNRLWFNWNESKIIK
jgi:dTDP-4-dehydrorhamnose 3,5-epimerase